MKATKSDIITLPNNHLRKPSKKVGLITTEIKDAIQKMIDATIDWEQHRKHEAGVALASIQIDIPLKIVIIRKDFENTSKPEFNVYINPTIVKYEGEVKEDFEGCLSIKDIYGKVPRHTKVRVKALTPEGKEIKLVAEGFLARVFQHEVDHTKGKVFIDLIEDNPDAFYKLDRDGKLHELDYEKDVKNNTDLWR
ncbi:MAG: peptide deformylase [bacterium]|nr:peptide deformylase [bacterium]